MELGFLDEIDWEHMFDDVQFPDNFFDATPAPEELGTDKSWIGDIEELLMKDDNDVVGGFTVNDILLDSPEIMDKDSPVPDNTNSNSVSEADRSPIEKNCGRNSSPNLYSISDDVALEVDDSKDDDTDDNDPLSKKRKRQLRNKDAAMRSRERKKMYVKDLEVKSRYLEAECRRLGRLLQCCYADNQMLRISLQSGSTFAMSKPESAVLSPESLLLGSLVWLMALMCLLPLPRLTLPSQGAVALGSIHGKNLGSVAQQRGKGAKLTEPWLSLSFMKTKKCSASRTKMKSNFASLVTVV